jgi:Lrp/AsnC family leucine-responsive transcriptional regulator
VSTAIDTLDERILAELQANGRLTMKALAERVGLSSPAMIERVRRLEERGVIAGYRAVVAPAALGRPLTALVLAEVQHADYGPFLEKLNSDASVAECHRITGEATFLVKVHVADPAALEQFVDVLSAAGARCETSLVLSSPVPWRQITPPEGAAGARARLPRRRRRTAAEPAAEAGPATASRGRGRGRRKTTG